MTRAGKPRNEFRGVCQDGKGDMGIRIHVCLGYGLIDLEGREDKRFNPNGYMLADSKTQEQNWNFDGYLKVLEKRDSLVHTLYTKCSDRPTKRKPNIYELLVHNDEYGEKNVLCIVPPTSLESHRRYDDTIDYYTYGGIPESHVKLIEDGIFPYIGLYIDKRTGRRVERGFILHRMMRSLHTEMFCVHEVVYGFTTMHKAAKSFGFDGYFEARDNLNTLVPPDIVALCEYTNLFVDPNTVYTLKPMLYAYWG